jgi:hypothetical protein
MVIILNRFSQCLKSIRKMYKYFSYIRILLGTNVDSYVYYH